MACDPFELERIHPEVADLIRKLGLSNLVVVGSVARKNKKPGDIDIWVNTDGFAAGEERIQRVRRIIRESGLQFSSPIPGAWTFRYPDVMVELLGISNVGASFSSVRRQARFETIAGLKLPVARPEHAGVSGKDGWNAVASRHDAAGILSQHS